MNWKSSAKMQFLLVFYMIGLYATQSLQESLYESVQPLERQESSTEAQFPVRDLEELASYYLTKKERNISSHDVSSERRERNGVNNQIQERKGISFDAAKEFLTVDKNQDKVGKVLGGLGGIGTLISIDYNGPPEKVIKQVGDAVLPIITAGLAFVPGGGLISGVVTAVWGLFSGIFGGGGAPKSPMEQMIENLQNEIDNIKKEIKELAAKLTDQMRKEMHDRLRSIVDRAIHGEIRRNEYVCGKYAILSRDFIEEMKVNKTIPESLRIEMMGLVHDCDNFLRDTADAFVYPEFADVLWLPAVMTTLVRGAFLAEVSNYGASLKIDPHIISLFFSEVRDDIRRTFALAGIGVEKRLVTLRNRNFTIPEYEGCEMQAQLMYLDRRIYPYGVPKVFHIFNDSSEMNMAEYNVSGDDAKHFQIFRTVDSKSINTLENDVILNCITGPDRLIILQGGKVSFRVNYVVNKSYHVRVLYFAIKKLFVPPNGKVTEPFEFDSIKDDKRVIVNEKQTELNIKIANGKHDNNTIQRFEFLTGYQTMENPRAQILANFNYNEFMRDKYVPAEAPRYRPHGVAKLGTYIMETVYSFNVESEKETKGKITVDVDFPFGTKILGLELIVLPIVK